MSSLTSPQTARFHDGPRPSGGGLPGAVAAEWIKLWSLRSTWWFLLSSVVLMAVVAPAFGVTMHPEGGELPAVADAAVVATGYVVEFVVVALAMLTVTAEYATGSITTTLQCVPQRSRMLIAKSITVGGVAFGTGLVLGLVGVALGGAAVEEGVFDGADAAMKVLAIAVHLTLLSVMTVGIAAIVRSSAGTITTVFLLLIVLPMLLQSLEVGFLTAFAQILPQGAGTQFMLGESDPYGPVTGLLLLIGWAVAAIVAGSTALRRRDA